LTPYTHEIKWNWGPHEGWKWLNTWRTNMPGHGCGSFVDEYMTCIYRKMGANMRCCRLNFQHVFIHAWFVIDCDCGVGGYFGGGYHDPYFRRD
jgi:hypothetical protein